jgi:hypothetical protein
LGFVFENVARLLVPSLSSEYFISHTTVSEIWHSEGLDSEYLTAIAFHISFNTKLMGGARYSQGNKEISIRQAFIIVLLILQLKGGLPAGH